MSRRVAAAFSLEFVRMIGREHKAMSLASSSEPVTNPRIAADVVCTSCGCLCDDIELTIVGDRILEARNACPLGRDQFVAFRPSHDPACLLDGQPATFDVAIERAARILTDAHSPLIFGLGDATTEAQRAGVSLGDWIGACVDIAGAESGGATMDALQSVGEVACTLGEIKNRADFIVVWRADPLVTHPRLFSRYALDPAGQFIPGGRLDRYCVVVDDRETQTVREAADQFIAIPETAEVDALWTLRALTKGVSLDPHAVETQTEIDLSTWQALTDRIRAARYGALFYGVGEGSTPAARIIVHGIHSWIRDLNATTRFVCLPLSPARGNGVGARNVLAWHTGFPGPVNLGRGYPRYGPGEFSAAEVLGKREVDAALIVSGDPVSPLATTAREHLGRIPCIVLTSGRNEPFGGAVVVFRTSVFGINTTGTVYRLDGVPLPSRSVLPSQYPSADRVLRAIESRARALAGPVAGGTVGI
jgi:formylmethanofuran dehydrogenase subunit B